jgi:hypothetical protein
MLNALRNIFRSKKTEEPDERIKRCPWKEDIYIDRSSWIGSGAYDSVKGQEYHSVICAADGPNSDKTMHHAYIGYWPDFDSFQSANEFAGTLWNRIVELVGIEVPVYVGHKDQVAHAGWCMSKRKTRPAGIHPSELPITFKGYK